MEDIKGLVKPSVFNLMSKDITSLYVLVFLPVAVFYVLVTGRGSTDIRLWITLILMWSPFFLWRLFYFKSLIERGIEVTGKIRKKSSFFGAFSKLVYSYSFDKERYWGERVLRRSERIDEMKPHDRVILLMDRENPKKTFLLDG
jgi:hypothetical protein